LTPYRYMALLTACDRVKSYNKMLDIYYARMKPHMLDWVAVGTLLKACDRLQRPDAAVEIVESLLDTYAGEMHLVQRIPGDVLERTMAILVRDGAGELAVRLVLQLELLSDNNGDDSGGQQEQEQGGGNNNPQQEQEQELMMIVDRLIATYETRSRTARGGHCYNTIGMDEKRHVPLLRVGYEDMDPVEKGALQLLLEDTAEEDGDDECDDDDAGDSKAKAEAEFTAACDALEALQHRPVSVSQRLYAGLCSALARCGRAGECRRLLYSYIKRGGVPSEEMYTSAIFSNRYVLCSMFFLSSFPCCL
jgi:hypothetical protein